MMRAIVLHTGMVAARVGHTTRIEEHGRAGGSWWAQHDSVHVVACTIEEACDDLAEALNEAR